MKALDEIWLENGRPDISEELLDFLLDGRYESGWKSFISYYNSTSYLMNTLIDAINVGNVRVMTTAVLEFRYESFSINEAWVNRDIKTEKQISPMFQLSGILLSFDVCTNISKGSEKRKILLQIC